MPLKRAKRPKLPRVEKQAENGEKQQLSSATSYFLFRNFKLV